MHAWEAIQKAVDYIEEHLVEEISTETLSEMFFLSPYYFQRLFKRLVRKPVQEYIKLRRMANVIELLNDSGKTITDIALKYGFSSHANFTRAFKEVYGITPEEYKNTKPLLNTFRKPDISMKYMMIDEGAPLIVGDIVLEIIRKKLVEKETYLGLSAEINVSGQMPVGESTGIDAPGQLWRKFHDEKEIISDIIDSNIGIGMSCMETQPKGVFTYFVGGICSNEYENTMKAFVKKELPAGDYIVCRIEAETFEKLVTEALDKAGKYFYGTWLPKHNLTTQPFSVEKYYTNSDVIKQLEPNCMEIWVAPIPITK